MLNLNKSDLIESVAKKASITKVQAEKEIEHVLTGIQEALKSIAKHGKDTGEVGSKGEVGKLQILNYFSIEVSYKPEHEAKNPRTKETVKVAGKNKIKITTGNLLNKSVN